MSTLWELWREGRVMHAEAGPHPLGFELRVYIGGRLLFSVAKPTKDDVFQVAEETKQAGTAEGWTAPYLGGPLPPDDEADATG